MKRVLLLVTAVVVLGGVGVGAWYYSQADNSDKKPLTAAAKEEKRLKEKLNEADNTDEKVKAFEDLSNHYVNSGEDDKALNSAEEAVKLKASVETYALLGFAAEEAGDINAAIAAYEKAASLSPKTSLDDARSDYTYYTGQAERLRSQQ